MDSLFFPWICPVHSVVQIDSISITPRHQLPLFIVTTICRYIFSELFPFRSKFYFFYSFLLSSFICFYFLSSYVFLLFLFFLSFFLLTFHHSPLPSFFLSRLPLRLLQPQLASTGFHLLFYFAQTLFRNSIIFDYVVKLHTVFYS